MDQQNIDFSDIEQFLLTHYKKCPIHKRLIMYLRIDNTEDPQVIKCQKCIDENKQQRFIDIVELLQSDDHFLFQKWPIHDDDTISENLEKIKQWPYSQYCDEINLIFDEMVEKIQKKKKEILKDLGQIQENQQKSLNYYKQIFQQEKLIDIIKSQFGDQEKQNEMILSIIKESEQNYESNKKQLIDLINEANKHLFDLTKVKNMKDEVLSLINMLKIFDNYQNNQNIEQLDKMSIKNSGKNLEEIKIHQFEDLDKCQNFKKINIDFREQNLKGEDLKELQNIFDKCKNITELQLNLQYLTLIYYGLHNITYKKTFWIYVRKTSIGDEAVKDITKGLVKHQNITNLQLLLEDNQIGIIGAKHLANQIEQFQNLIQLNLDLSQNLICNETVQNIAIAIQKNKNMISIVLNFSYNKIDTEAAIHIAKALNQLSNLNKLFLYLDGCKIQDEGAIYISESIKKLKHISQIGIGLRNNDISFKGVQNISDSINNFEKINLLGINFQENNIGNKGLSYLAKKLQNYQNLETLDLAFGANNINNLGVLHVLQAIQNYKNIVRLSLYFWKSNLKQVTAKFIAKILQEFHNLSDLKLNLEDNNIGIEGCELILNGIEKKNQKIKKLELSLIKNNIDAVNIEQITKKLDMLKEQTKNEWTYKI
ncbi:hypothetical protein ABPG74_013062 [Tetrahymena malaccensis]